jgi:hypothetical protein
MARTRIAAAVDRAYACALHLPTRERTQSHHRPIRVAMGDPQAPLETMLEVLEANELLADDGWLRPDVQLVSVGDHFDWGSLADAPRATDDALALLSWLAHHDDDHVVLVVGNHDLARVGELVSFDDETFVRVRDEASAVYVDGKVVDEDGEVAFLARWPELPSAESAARDFAAFRVQQRTLVAHLLRQGRYHLAVAVGPRALVTHAGITTPQLAAVGVDAGSAHAIAAGLDERLQAAVRAWDGVTPFRVPELHWPGDATIGEGGGMLYHRPVHPDAERGDARGRRFDPRTLPRGVVQIVGHIRDEKCRKLLGPWAEGDAPEEGQVRHLVSDGTRVRYAAGPGPEPSPEEAKMLFIDGGMRHLSSAERYELLDLDRLEPFAR